MSETTNEQIATDAPEDVEGHNARWPAVPEETDDVDGHHFGILAAPDGDDQPEADDTEGHNFKI